MCAYGTAPCRTSCRRQRCRKPSRNRRRSRRRPPSFRFSGNCVCRSSFSRPFLLPLMGIWYHIVPSNATPSPVCASGRQNCRFYSHQQCRSTQPTPTGRGSVPVARNSNPKPQKRQNQTIRKNSTIPQSNFYSSWGPTPEFQRSNPRCSNPRCSSCSFSIYP